MLRIEHPVADFDRWRRAFDTDPVGREPGGVRRYRIMRAAGDPNYALIDLEFGARDTAEEFLAALRQLWERVDVISDPKARIVQLVEEREPSHRSGGRSICRSAGTPGSEPSSGSPVRRGRDSIWFRSGKRRVTRSPQRSPTTWPHAGTRWTRHRCW
jgi:hypothetical protein